MIYNIKGKPYVKVANYYKEISITKNGNEFMAKPVGGKETRIENPNPKEVIEMSIEEFYSKKNNSSNEKRSIDI